MKRPPLGAELIVARLGGRDSPLFLLEELAEFTAVRSKGEAPDCNRSLLATPALVEGRAAERVFADLLAESAPAVEGREDVGLGRRGAGPILAPST